MTLVKRALPVALACAALATAGCGAGTTQAQHLPSGTLNLSSSNGPLSTSSSNRFALSQNTSQSVKVEEDWYIGAFTATVVNGGGNGCVTVAAAPGATAGAAPFTVSAQPSSGSCTYPQTADIQFVDAWGNTTMLYVQAS